MTKAELIRKIAKYVGVPDTDAKIFFELFLKKTSAVVEVGQSIFVKDFGYFHLIKGSIKKPVFSFKDNEVSEEEVELVLFSEDKDLRKSDTKGLVFNIPFFDEEDYHPIDSSFSLSIGKPLIPLRGVPFDEIYIPTSGYEYRRLIESKVEKLIAASEIVETEERFPTLVIDARAYNSNQVHLQWNEETDSRSTSDSSTDDFVAEKPELSEYEKQAKELKNIAWDFGEDLSKQIEAESILDITDERLKQDKSVKGKIGKETESDFIENSVNKIELSSELKIIPDTESKPESQFVEEIVEDDSSKKLNELLENESTTAEFEAENLIDDSADNLNEILENESETVKFDLEKEIVIENVKDDYINNLDDIDLLKDDLKENISEVNADEEIEIKDEVPDNESWESTSKYFETYKPVAEIPIDDETESETELMEDIILENDQVVEEITENNEIEEPNMNSEIPKEADEVMDDKNKLESEEVIEQKAEYFQPAKKKNLVAFIVFPLLVILVSAALYWYLEFYKKNEVSIQTKEIALKTENAKIISRSFDIPVSFPYQPKLNETIISETVPEKIEQPQDLSTEKIVDNKPEQKKPEEKKIEKVEPKKENIESSKPNNNIIPTGKSLNVGNNIYKYGNYFVVQVAAFRSKVISDNEAGKYMNKGYTAIVEAAEIPERGTWYRVRVGNFSTKEEAQNFVNKNIR
jgi:cell division septation protein DedD/nucleoid DNA-binding protein